MIPETLHLIFDGFCPFPKELISIILQYKAPSQLQVTELFLKILFGDYLTEPTRQAHCNIAKQWADEINIINLSTTCLYFVSHHRLKMNSNFWEKMIGGALKNHFPKVDTLTLPLEMRIRPVHSMTTQTVASHENISQDVFRDRFNEKYLDEFASRKILVLCHAPIAREEFRKEYANKPTFSCQFYLNQTAQIVKRTLKIVLFEYRKKAEGIQANTPLTVFNEATSCTLLPKPNTPSNRFAMFAMCKQSPLLHGCVVS